MKILLKFCLVYLVSFQLHAAESKYRFSPYGRIKATALYSNHFLNSFSYMNTSAPTSAGSDVGFPFENQSNLSFQVAQSRFGSDINYEDVFGNLEFDFIDFSVSSPTTEAKPRLRRAFVGYKINSNNQIQVGQDWDTFSPFVPTVLDYVGLNFGAGNTGFMRQQIKWKYTNDKVISEVSLGMPGKNPTPSMNEIELKSSPAIAYRLSYQDFGVSLYHSTINKNFSGNRDVNGVNAFFKTPVYYNIQLTSEFYTGHNMNEAALLGLSHIVSGNTLRETGGYLTLTYLSQTIGDFNISYGMAKINNPEHAEDYLFDITTKKIIEDGLINNQVIRFYWNKKLQEGLSFVTELSYFKTERKFGINDFRTEEGLSSEAGLLLVF